MLPLLLLLFLNIDFHALYASWTFVLLLALCLLHIVAFTFQALNGNGYAKLNGGGNTLGWKKCDSDIMTVVMLEALKWHSALIFWMFVAGFQLSPCNALALHGTVKVKWKESRAKTHNVSSKCNDDKYFMQYWFRFSLSWALPFASEVWGPQTWNVCSLWHPRWHRQPGTRAGSSCWCH